jgi:hypothetical protein
MKNALLIALFGVLAFVFNVAAQPRPVETKPSQDTPVRPAPESFSAKYEGGMFGFSKKEEGTLKFEDVNERLVFFGKDGKEKFAIPYQSMLVVFPQSKSVQSTTGKVVSVIPYAGLFGGFIKEKRQYLIINFDDPDIEAQGLVNFKVANKDLLDSVLFALAQKAELQKRGDAYYRPKKVKIEGGENK